MRDVWHFLDQHRRPADLERALHTLATDRNENNAAVAAAILTNFPDEPRAWWALLDAHRVSREYIAATASQAMRGLNEAGERTIDWRPVASSIRAILDGTNVFVMEPMLGFLAATRIVPDLAPVLLREGGADLVLAHLGASDERMRATARSFLVQISGVDYGESPAAWARWTSSLQLGACATCRGPTRLQGMGDYASGAVCPAPLNASSVGPPPVQRGR